MMSLSSPPSLVAPSACCFFCYKDSAAATASASATQDDSASMTRRLDGRRLSLSLSEVRASCSAANAASVVVSLVDDTARAHPFIRVTLSNVSLLASTMAPSAATAQVAVFRGGQIRGLEWNGSDVRLNADAPQATARLLVVDCAEVANVHIRIGDGGDGDVSSSPEPFLASLLQSTGPSYADTLTFSASTGSLTNVTVAVIDATVSSIGGNAASTMVLRGAHGVSGCRVVLLRASLSARSAGGSAFFNVQSSFPCTDLSMVMQASKVSVYARVILTMAQAMVFTCGSSVQRVDVDLTDSVVVVDGLSTDCIRVHSVSLDDFSVRMLRSTLDVIATVPWGGHTAIEVPGATRLRVSLRDSVLRAGSAVIFVSGYFSLQDAVISVANCTLSSHRSVVVSASWMTNVRIMLSSTVVTMYKGSRFNNDAAALLLYATSGQMRDVVIEVRDGCVLDPRPFANGEVLTLSSKDAMWNGSMIVRDSLILFTQRDSDANARQLPRSSFVEKQSTAPRFG